MKRWWEALNFTLAVFVGKGTCKELIIKVKEQVDNRSVV